MGQWRFNEERGGMYWSKGILGWTYQVSIINCERRGELWRPSHWLAISKRGAMDVEEERVSTLCVSFWTKDLALMKRTDTGIMDNNHNAWGILDASYIVIDQWWAEDTNRVKYKVWGIYWILLPSTYDQWGRECNVLKVDTQVLAFKVATRTRTHARVVALGW